RPAVQVGPKRTVIHPPYRVPLALGADEPVWPAPFRRILGADFISREQPLERKQRLRKPFHNARLGTADLQPEITRKTPTASSLRHLHKRSAEGFAKQGLNPSLFW